MSLVTPASVQKLQTALHAKAKESPGFRFYAVYDKVYRKDVLGFAYACSQANGGAAGVDEQKFEDIEAYGEERWLDELGQELKHRTYRPLPVRRVYIQGGWEDAKAVRHTCNPRPSGAVGCGVGARTNLRG
jgi:RNA-directed DNA polymerase